MAKELPYFRFTAQEWQNGDISLESYEYKGLFIDICSYYWVKNCSITLAMLEKKFSNASNIVEQLIELEILQMYDTENINIDFLDEQFDLLSEKRKKRSEAGRIGGLKKSSNAKAMLKQKSSYKDKDKEKDNINISFDMFWNAYNKKIGSKPKLTKKWNNLKASEREAIMLYIPRYIIAQPDPQFRKNAETFLNNESWKDELIGLPPEQKKLIPKLHYATQEELLKEFKTEQAIIDISKENTYVCNAKGVLFPLRDKDKSRNREGEYILGTDRKMYKITI